MTENHPQVGVATIVLYLAHPEIWVLLGKRKGSHGAGTWSLPGGHLEFGEDPAGCAWRETVEETGLVVELLEQGPFVSTMVEGKHYVTLFYQAFYQGSRDDVKLREPDKCEEWQWFSISKLPEPLFAPLENFLSNWTWMCKPRMSDDDD